MVNKKATIPISAEMKVFVVGLGNYITWKKLPTDKISDYTFIDNLEDEVLDLMGIAQSDKTGGTTGHIGLIMIAAEFALVPGVVNSPFVRLAHSGAVDYNNLTACATMQQHTERRCAGAHMNIAYMRLK